MFKRARSGGIVSLDGRTAYPPDDPEYLAWLAAGNAPAPADPLPPPDPDPLPELLAAIDRVTTLTQAKRLLKAIARRALLRHLATDPDGALP